MHNSAYTPRKVLRSQSLTRVNCKPQRLQKQLDRFCRTRTTIRRSDLNNLMSSIMTSSNPRSLMIISLKLTLDPPAICWFLRRKIRSQGSWVSYYFTLLPCSAPLKAGEPFFCAPWSATWPFINTRHSDGSFCSPPPGKRREVPHEPKKSRLSKFHVWDERPPSI